MQTVSAANPSFGGKVPHLMCGKEDIAKVVLLPGDPGRVEMFVDLCENFKIISSNREYTVGTGTYRGVPVSVCSTGIGAPSTEIAVLELIELGAQALIRIGGAGVLKEEIKCGEMVINTAAMRRGGASCFYAPAEYPAVASCEVVKCLEDACKRWGISYWKGISASVGSFFAGQGRPALGRNFHKEKFMQEMVNLNILNMEMESETIMTLGSLFDVMTGCICAVHANRITDEWMENFSDAQRNMCKIALEAVVQLTEEYLS